MSRASSGALPSRLSSDQRAGILLAYLLNERLCDAQRQWMENQLGGWSTEQHAELDQVLAKFSHALLGDDADRRLIDQ